MRKRMAALTLALCLGLSGCALKKEEENASLLGRAAELGEELVLLTVDGREVPAWRYLYWLAFTCDQIREKYKDSGLTLDWETPVPGGTLADYAKDQALANTALYATVENWAARYGCVLSEAEREALVEPAFRILKAIADTRADWTGDCDAIVQGCSAAYHADRHHFTMVYADYYFLEALYKLAGADVHMW